MTRLLRLILVLVIVFLLLLVGSLGSRYTRLRPGGLVLEVVAVFQEVVTGSAEAVESVWQGYFSLVRVARENEILRRERARLQARIGVLHEAELENGRLKRLLDFKEQSELPVIGGRVVAWDPRSWFKTVIIDRGAAEGLKPGMPVVTHEGVVGRLIEVAPHYAKVMLLVDYNSAIDALVQRSRVQGILAGRSTSTCLLKYVLKSDDLKSGDLLITSGQGGAFPKGLPLGYVIGVTRSPQGLFQDVTVAPAVNLDRLEEVLVILHEDSLL
jgi:rod shape-determining protein MreC